jgi:class 3 adenylate cyclase
MPAVKDARSAAIDEVLSREANRALVRGGVLTAITAGIGGAAILATSLAGLAKGLEEPGVATLVIAAVGLLVSRLAKAGLVRGLVMYAVFVPVVSMPTGLFIAAHFTLPAGAATYLTGPFSLLYVALIVVSGFMFDWKLSVVSGFVAAAGYLCCYALARPFLAHVTAPDPIQLQDLNDPALFAFRAMIIGFAAGFVGLLSVVARRHIERVLEEEQGRERITRLFGEYVSPEVARKLVSAQSLSAGEHKEVAVLFSDIRGFTALSEKSKPEELVSRLNAYFDEMVEAIGEHGGVVDKFIGDAVMAVFGGVLPLEKPSDSAVKAALAMRARLVKLNQRWKEQGLAPLENGIGIHCGEVVQGSIGSRGRKDFTVIGDAVNTASRVEGLTKSTPQRVVVTSKVFERLGEPLRACCVSLGKTHVKGKEVEIEIYGVPDAGPGGALPSSGL